MRFEIGSAFAMGAVFPMLAACLHFCRRNYTFVLADFRTDLQDYLAGVLLLIAGWLSVRARPSARAFTVLAWSFFASMMFGSSWGQIDDTLRGEVEPYNTAIIVFKVTILAVSLVALALSVRFRISISISPALGFRRFHYHERPLGAGRMPPAAKSRKKYQATPIGQDASQQRQEPRGCVSEIPPTSGALSPNRQLRLLGGWGLALNELADIVGTLRIFRCDTFGSLRRPQVLDSRVLPDSL